jgi:choline-sulfatase
MATNTLPEHPNLLYIMTDQERYTQHFPDGWEEANLPNMQRLKSHGVAFTNAFTCTSMCSPSRTAMFTGRYPSQTGVTKTMGVGERYAPNKYDPTDIELDPKIPNLATMLHKSGQYGKIHYLGKWHMSKGFNDVQELLPRQIAAYGFEGWVPPDGGQDWRVTNIAGGYFEKDNAYTQEAIKFIKERAQEGSNGKPWCLVLSLINPHDIWTYPKSFDQTGYSEDMLAPTDPPIPLPETIDEELHKNCKPSAQWQIKETQESFIGPLAQPLKFPPHEPSPAELEWYKDRQHKYLNFYGNLLKLVDSQIGEVLNALGELTDSTIIVRTADHGEMGLAHGGLRQKMFNVYEETIHIPLIISNPALVPQERTAEQLVSSIDILPTIAGLLKVKPPEGLQGYDYSAIVLDDTPPEKERTEMLFTFDDFRVEANKPSAVEAADRIRCVRTKEWKYARYFHADSSYKEEYEMYDLTDTESPLETNNLACPENPNYNNPDVVAKREELKTLLAELEKNELPRSVDNFVSENNIA